MSDTLPCKRCAAPATVHLTQILDGKILKVHLCEACAAQGGATDAPVFDLAELLMAQKAAQPAGVDPSAGLTCPECGQTESAFRKHARFGCVTCYTLFSDHLADLLPRIQPEHTHTGKHPVAARAHAVRAELRRAEAALAAAVKGEHYEEAVRLRDRIRTLETERCASPASPRLP